MTDARADDATPFEEDRLPWLEAVEDDDGGDGPSALKRIVGVLIALAGIGAIVGGIFWMNNRSDQLAGGDAELIKAPEGDYKVRPDDPGGMAVEGEGDTAFAASEGADPKGAINTGAEERTVDRGAGADQRPGRHRHAAGRVRPRRNRAARRLLEPGERQFGLEGAVRAVRLSRPAVAQRRSGHRRRQDPLPAAGERPRRRRHLRPAPRRWRILCERGLG